VIGLGKSGDKPFGHAPDPGASGKDRRRRCDLRWTDVLALPIVEVRKIRGKRIAMIFQDPMTSLNPFLKISTQLMEVTQLHLGHNKKQAREHAIKMLKTVGIP
jgi:ABC-type microcin C transport system duplicated ATPase subunit YejF